MVRNLGSPRRSPARWGTPFAPRGTHIGVLSAQNLSTGEGGSEWPISRTTNRLSKSSPRTCGDTRIVSNLNKSDLTTQRLLSSTTVALAKVDYLHKGKRQDRTEAKARPRSRVRMDDACVAVARDISRKTPTPSVFSRTIPTHYLQKIGFPQSSKGSSGVSK